jgi:D-proline reductase (dithiol) PrdB
VSLIARVLEAGGISTVTFSNARDITTSAGNPRLVFTNYPLGNCVGRPFDRENQRAILKSGFELLESARQPGIVVDTPHRWAPNTDWMRLIFSDAQPFISDTAEAKRQEALKRAREQKAQQQRRDT